MKVSPLLPPLLALATVVACGGGSTNNTPPTLSCTSPGTVNLTVGQAVVLDPATSGGCIQIPDPAGGTTAHLVVAVATNGQEATNGISTSYTLTGGDAAAAVASSMSEAAVGGFRKPGTAEAFHSHLRQMDRELARGMGTAVLPLAPPVLRVPPDSGTQRTFNVCATTQCNSFVSVTATAEYVGPNAAIYVDNASPTGGYAPSDIAAAGALFENPTYGLHVLDTTAFGPESDVDGNGVVVILLTPRVNKLSGTCSGGIIAGFFLGLDLTSGSNSNNGEVFYSMVPDPTNATGTCAISTAQASDLLPVTFIHEFQHMISFNQHVLVRASGFTEDTWLNEGLSHYAEELGGRQIDDSACPPGTANSCRGQYISGDLYNAYDYLDNPEATYLIEPGTSNGTLAERGANWLFVRWLVDQFATDTVLGTAFTRQLVMTADHGSVNVENRTGVAFSTLVPQWQLANFVEGDTLFVQSAATSRLRYKTWDLRRIYTLNNFPKQYPLVPAFMTTGVSRSGTLRAGSGYHLIVLRAPGDTAANLRLTTGNAAAQARFGVVRLQ